MVKLRRRLNVKLKVVANRGNLSSITETTVEGERDDHVPEEIETAQNALANIEKVNEDENAQSSPLAEIKKAKDIWVQKRSRGGQELVEDNIQETAPAKRLKVDVELDTDKNTTVSDMNNGNIKRNNKIMFWRVVPAIIGVLSIGIAIAIGVSLTE